MVDRGEDLQHAVLVEVVGLEEEVTLKLTREAEAELEAEDKENLGLED